MVGPNPGGVEGLVSISNGYDSSGFMEFDRRDGSLPRTGSINMQDLAGAKHDINNAGGIAAQTVVSSDRITTGEYLQIGGLAVDGSSCPSNGLLGRNSAGLVLSCQSGIWKGTGGKLGVTWEKMNTPGQGWVPMNCPDGHLTAWHSCKQRT